MMELAMRPDFAKCFHDPPDTVPAWLIQGLYPDLDLEHAYQIVVQSKDLVIVADRDRIRWHVLMVDEETKQVHAFLNGAMEGEQFYYDTAKRGKHKCLAAWRQGYDGPSGKREDLADACECKTRENEMVGAVEGESVSDALCDDGGSRRSGGSDE